MKKADDSQVDARAGSAGVPPAACPEPSRRAGASRPGFGEVKIRDRGRLPHWEADNATYFVTFRLADSLPKAVLDHIQSERLSIIANAKSLNRELSPDERKRLQSLSTKRIEEYLDNSSGICHLKSPRIAEMVACALMRFDDKRYRLFAWCIKPNHVHVVFRIFPGHELASVIHSWKSFTAHEINRLLRLEGSLWQREYYDHLIRSEGELEHALESVEQNPAKAGLRGWKWVWRWGRDVPTPAAETAALR